MIKKPLWNSLQLRHPSPGSWANTGPWVNWYGAGEKEWSNDPVHGTGTKKVGDLNRANCTMFGTQEQKMNANALENDSQEMTRCNPEGG